MLKKKNVVFLILAIFLTLSMAVAFGQIQVVTKLATANPSLSPGSLESGLYIDTNVSDDSSLILKENSSFQLLAEFNSWQQFSEASKSKVTLLKVVLEGRASSADDDWFVSFWDYSTNSWSSNWYQLGSTGFGPVDVTYSVTIASQDIQGYLDQNGDFRLRLADGRSSSQSLDDLAQTTIYLDYLAVQIGYDITTPRSMIISPADSTRFAGGESISISGTANDDSGSGVKEVRVSTDGGNNWSVAAGAGNWTFNWTVPTTEGGYEIQSQAVDNVGNIETPPAKAAIYVDRTGPRSTVLEPGSNDWVKGTTRVRATIDDSTAGNGNITAAEFAVDSTSNPQAMQAEGSWGSSPVQDVSFDWDTTLLGDGSHTIYVRGKDDVGNFGPWSAGVRVKIDNTPPEITDVYAYSHTTTATVGWRTNEPATSQVEYGTRAQGPVLTQENFVLRKKHQVELEDLLLLTIYRYRVISRDAAGNVAVSEWNIFLAGDPDPHQGGNYAGDTELCAECHRTHSSVGSRLSVYFNQKDQCFTCHDVAGSGSINFTQAEFERPYRHSLYGYDTTSYKQCANCHESHVIPTIASNLLVNPTDTTELWTIVTNTASPFYDSETSSSAMYYWCERCHQDSAVTGTLIYPRRSVTGYVPYAVTVVWQTLKSTVDDSGTTTGTWQYFTANTTGTRYGYNDVSATGNSAHGRAVSSPNAASKLLGTWRGGYTATYPALSCLDCHETHGSIQPWLIVPSITAGGFTTGSYDMTLRTGQKSFCNSCHDPSLVYATDVYPDCSTAQKCTDCHKHSWQF